jgi:hypothetical protein
VAKFTRFDPKNKKARNDKIRSFNRNSFSEGDSSKRFTRAKREFMEMDLEEDIDIDLISNGRIPLRF